MKSEETATAFSANQWDRKGPVQMKLEYDGPGVLQANQLFTAQLRITTSRDLRRADRIVLAVRHVSDLGDAQMYDPGGENYISVTGPGEWKLGPANDWRRHPWNRGIDLRLQDGTLRDGETLIVNLGDPAGGSPGYRCQSFAESAFRFRLGVFAADKEEWTVLPLEFCPVLRVTGNRAVRLSVIVSRPTRNDGVLTVHTKPEDAFGNVAHDVPEKIALLLGETVPVAQVAFRPDRPVVSTLSVPEKTSWQRIIATTPDGAFWARSSPFGPSPAEGYELFFGEIHGQSSLCDGTNSPAELYAYARDAAGLDFAAVTSHDFELTARDWQVVQRAARDAHVPGEFVTFLGFEWSGQHAVGGDNNIYFLDDDAPLVYSAPCKVYDAWDPAEGEISASRNLSEVIEQLAGHRFMVVPHCGGRCCNLDFYDPSVMPLFEIHSCHRTYEHVAHEAIRRGIRFGFIGGSDDHRGALGDSHPAARERFFSSHNGLVAVYATDLTRESLWEAFFARRVYATNGPRIVLTVEIDDHHMGSKVIAAPGISLKMSFWTCLDALMDRIEVMRDDTLIKTFYNPSNQADEFSGGIELQATAEPHAYYVKIFQTDGGRAWSSPIWVVPPRE